MIAVVGYSVRCPRSLGYNNYYWRPLFWQLDLTLCLFKFYESQFILLSPWIRGSFHHGSTQLVIWSFLKILGYSDSKTTYVTSPPALEVGVDFVNICLILCIISSVGIR